MKIRLKLNKALLTLIFLGYTTGLLAQQTFKYRADISKVDTSAFYRMNLPPALLAKSATDLADVRLFNKNGKFVPYIFGNRLPIKTQQSFIAFPQVTIKSHADTLTTFVAENKQHLTINQLNLKLRNASVDRIVSLVGSDDLTNWYAIKENILLNKAGDEGSGNGIYDQLLNFPASTYRYFKIQVNNNRKEPVAILQAGIYQTQTEKPVYTLLPNVKFNQKDTARLSHIWITFNDAYRVNKLRLSIAGTKYYKRAVSIYSVTGKSRVLLADTAIASNGDNDLYVSAKTKSIELEIANQDNPPLVVSNVAAWQLEQSLVAYLDKGNDYQLLFGDTAAITPVYDLDFFADSLQRNLAVLQIGDVGNNTLYKHKVVATKPHMPAWIIWVSIIAVIALLTFLTIKMTKEVSTRKNNEGK